MTCKRVKHQFWVHNFLKNQAKKTQNMSDVFLFLEVLL